MGILFNADEIFEMAEQIERNGARFYRKVADQAKEQSSRDLLLKLAGMEDDHEKTFASIRAEFADAAKDDYALDPESQAVLYLRAFASGHIFDVKVDPSKKITGREPMDRILHEAIGLEKDSIAFYTGIREMVPANLGKDKIDTIIKEEMKHVTELSDELESLGLK